MADQTNMECYVLSYNVNGINEPVKRAQILHECKKSKAMIVMLQETHFKENNYPHLSLKTYPQVYMSNNPTKKATGVLTLIHKDLPFKHLDTLSDKEGRYILIKGILVDQICTIANVYVPNTGQTQFLKYFLKTLENFSKGSIILGGDFNMALNPLTDTSSKRSNISYKGLKEIKKLFAEMQLIDVWRAINPKKRDFTHFSKTFSVYSRIDYIYTSQRWLHLFNLADIGNFHLSDHAPVRIKFKIPQTSKQEFTWRLNETMLHREDIRKKIQLWISQIIQENSSDNINQATVWETLKCVLRGHLIALGSKLKKEKEKEISKIISNIASLEQTHKETLAKNTLLTLENKRIQLKTLLNEKVRKSYMRIKQRYYELGDKCNKHFAQTLKKMQPITQITSIKTNKDTLISDTKGIASSFQDYYQSLYKIRLSKTSIESIEKIDKFIEEADLQKLTPDQSQMIDSPFSLTEIEKCIDSLSPGKSPGPDGFSAIFYKTFKETLSPLLLKYFNSISKTSGFHPQAQEAHITIIPKPGKDPQLCSSYRPISLINIDLKIYAKIIGNRIKQHLPDLIHTDQAGFIPRREGKENTAKVISLIRYAQQKHIPSLILTTDAEKAFDRVSWEFLDRTLAGIGLGQITRQRILALYEKPTARIRVNGTLSPKVQIFNGTRQGCPLSPTLFILVMETLLARIRNCPDISGIIVASKEYKCAAFADDLLLFITKPTISLPNVISLMKDYGNLSNFKVNYTKSEILNINIPNKAMSNLKQNFPFKWADPSIKYLGIKIQPDIEKAYSDNYLPLITSLQKTIGNWGKLQLSWFGRIQAVKIMLMPRLLYLFQVLPIHIPHSFFTSIKSLFTRFIWNGKNPRLKYRQLILPKEKGGRGLPDAYSYYIAIHLARILNWVSGEKRKDWCILEQSFSPIPLENIIWAEQDTYSCETKQHPLIQATLNVWKRNKETYMLTSSPYILQPLIKNPNFPPGLEKGSFDRWSVWENRQTRISDFLKDNKMIPMADIQKRWGKHPRDIWNYNQLHHYIQTNNSKYWNRPLTLWERLVTEPQLLDKPLSKLYKLLINATSPPSRPFCLAWEKELDITLSDIAWARIFKTMYKTSRASRTNEAVYKLVTRWHYTPEKLKKMFPKSSDICWRCNSHIGTHTHIWLKCPELKLYWTDVLGAINQVTDFKFTIEDAAPLLLNIYPHKNVSVTDPLTLHLLQSAKALIPRKWKSTEAPTFMEWLNNINEIRQLEEISLMIHNKSSLYWKIWTPWLNYTKSL
uniref:Reverse transcriptase domain-containing protein n=1 Tax=Xenopus tropicalis TaxID=8364 RepID=A0A803JJA9_XENTR